MTTETTSPAENVKASDQPIVTTHELKVWPQFFGAVANLKKPFEIRKNDRDFKVGDMLRLREWSPETEEYTGEYVVAEITYMTDWEQKPGYVVLGIDVTSGSPDYPLCITYSTIRGASIKPGSKDVELYFDSNESANELCEHIRRRQFSESL